MVAWGWDLVPKAGGSKIYQTGAAILAKQQAKDPVGEIVKSAGVSAVAAAPIILPLSLASLAAKGSAATGGAVASITGGGTAATAGGTAAATAAPVAVKSALGSRAASLLLGGAAGALVGSLLSGGIDQTQKASQETNVTPTQDTNQNQRGAIDTTLRGDVDSTQDTTQNTTASTQGTTTYGGEYVFDLNDIRDFGFSPTTITSNTTTASPSTDLLSGLLNWTPLNQAQQAIPTQITITTPAQEQTQEATSLDTGLIGLIILGAAILFMGNKGEKK